MKNLFCKDQIVKVSTIYYYIVIKVEWIFKNNENSSSFTQNFNLIDFLLTLWKSLDISFILMEDS